MSPEEQAREFLEKSKGMKRNAYLEALYALDKDVQKVIQREQYAEHRREMASRFTPDKAGKSQEELSPSGKYKLVITSFDTKKGCWNYSQGGGVFKLGSDEPIAIIQRNYGSFPFSWVEEHANGHDYLIGGEDYQGQTVVELDTGERLDSVPFEELFGHGFCWVEHRYDPQHQMLIVAGCHWACPYEFRFHDFSDPMKGWPEIQAEASGDRIMIDCDSRWPEIREDGTIQTFQDPWDDHDEDDPEDMKRDPAAIMTFKREGLKLTLLEEWVADEEKDRRQKAEESRQRYEQWLKDFRASDPLYTTAKRLWEGPGFAPESHMGVGVTHKNWCPHFDKEERRITKRIIKKAEIDDPGWTVDLEWGAETGPIKLILYKDGKTFDTKWFDHSVAEMEKAFGIARELTAS